MKWLLLVLGILIIFFAFCMKKEKKFAVSKMLKDYTDASVHEYSQKVFWPLIATGIIFFFPLFEEANPKLKIVRAALWTVCLIWLILVTLKVPQRRPIEELIEAEFGEEALSELYGENDKVDELSTRADEKTNEK